MAMSTSNAPIRFSLHRKLAMLSRWVLTASPLPAPLLALHGEPVRAVECWVAMVCLSQGRIHERS